MDFLYTDIIHAYQASMPKSVDIILMKIFNENNKNKCFSFKTALLIQFLLIIRGVSGRGKI